MEVHRCELQSDDANRILGLTNHVLKDLVVSAGERPATSQVHVQAVPPVHPVPTPRLKIQHEEAKAHPSTGHALFRMHHMCVCARTRVCGGGVGRRVHMRCLCVCGGDMEVGWAGVLRAVVRSHRLNAQY